MVTKLMEGNHGKRHVVVMENHLTLVGLFKELALHRTYAIGTMQCDRIGIPQFMKNTKELNCASQ